MNKRLKKQPTQKPSILVLMGFRDSQGYSVGRKQLSHSILSDDGFIEEGITREAVTQ